jgi:hypothetical protein
MNAQILIHAVVQQTMVFIAQLATAGGVRAPLASLANQILLNLTTELQNQGVRKNVIADMFGMTLRTYHRRVHELAQSESVEGRSLWEAVFEHVQKSEPISAGQVYHRFARDDREVVASVLNDLVDSGICYRSGRGSFAVYRVASDADFVSGDSTRSTANEYLVWQAIYRNGPVTRSQLATLTRLSESACDAALERLLTSGRAERAGENLEQYTSSRIDVPVGQAHGWEAAVFDHYQAMLSAICAKLSQGDARSDKGDLTGGATYSLDLWPGHPLESEVLGTLRRVRAMLEELRERLDETNQQAKQVPSERLVFYFGQHFKSDRGDSGER